MHLGMSSIWEERECDLNRFMRRVLREYKFSLYSMYAFSEEPHQSILLEMVMFAYEINSTTNTTLKKIVAIGELHQRHFSL